MNHDLLPDLRRLALAALTSAAVFVAAGCGSDADTTTDDGDAGTLEVSTSPASQSPTAAFEAAPGNSVVYRDGGYMEIKYVDSDTDTTRLLVVSPDNKDGAMDMGRVSGEDFKLMGRKSPVGVTVLGENELKGKFYDRWDLESDA